MILLFILWMVLLIILLILLLIIFFFFLIVLFLLFFGIFLFYLWFLDLWSNLIQFSCRLKLKQIFHLLQLNSAWFIRIKQIKQVAPIALIHKNVEIL